MPVQKNAPEDKAPVSVPDAEPAPVAQAAEPEGGEVRHVLLDYVGDIGRVVAPFGLLAYGEVVASPARWVERLLASRLFQRHQGADPQEGSVRHP